MTHETPDPLIGDLTNTRALAAAGATLTHALAQLEERVPDVCKAAAALAVARDCASRAMPQERLIRWLFAAGWHEASQGDPLAGRADEAVAALVNDGLQAQLELLQELGASRHALAHAGASATVALVRAAIGPTGAAAWLRELAAALDAENRGVN